jgi:hypothetical protein
MMNYILGIEVDKCEDDEFCLHKLAYKNQCKATLDKCSYPIKNNPLCFCNKMNECQGRFKIHTKDERTYILYDCQLSCPHFLKNKDDANKLLKLVNSPLLYYGKSLKTLIDKLGIKEQKDSDLDELINYFSNIFETVNSRA